MRKYLIKWAKIKQILEYSKKRGTLAPKNRLENDIES